MTSKDDLAELLGRVVLRDRSAFSSLYELTSAKLFGVVLRILKNRSEAEDALQEVYVKIWNRAKGFDPEKARPMTWLISIARNQAIDLLRKRRESIGDDLVMERLEDKGPTPEEAAIASSERAAIELCLDQLDAPRAEAVRLTYLEGFAYKDVAQKFDLPLNTVRTWLRRSLQSLKTCLST